MRHRLFVHLHNGLLSQHFQAGVAQMATLGIQRPDAEWARAMLVSVKASADALTDDVMDRATVFAPPTPVSVTQGELDVYVGIQHDRWIETAGLHAFLYTGAANVPQPDTQQPPPGFVHSDLSAWLSDRKSPSSDISGAVGEGLLTGVLIKTYQHRIGDFAHLNPKSTRMPDFAVVRPSTSFWSVVGGGGARPHQTYVPIETKTVSGVSQKATLKRQIRAALVQLLSFWLRVGSHQAAGPSAIFLAVLNRTRKAYDLVLIHGQ